MDHVKISAALSGVEQVIGDLQVEVHESEEATEAARGIAVALEQDDAELRRLLRFLHKNDPGAFLAENLPEGPVPRDACGTCYQQWPCETRRLVDDDEGLADLLRAEIEKASNV